MSNPYTELTLSFIFSYKSIAFDPRISFVCGTPLKANPIINIFKSFKIILLVFK